jgi:hypothetical protein
MASIVVGVGRWVVLSPVNGKRDAGKMPALLESVYITGVNRKRDAGKMPALLESVYITGVGASRSLYFSFPYIFHSPIFFIPLYFSFPYIFN